MGDGEIFTEMPPFRATLAGCIGVFQEDKSTGVEAPLNIRVQETVVVLKVSLESEVERGVADEATKPQLVASKPQQQRAAEPGGWMKKANAVRRLRVCLSLGQRMLRQEPPCGLDPSSCPRIEKIKGSLVWGMVSFLRSSAVDSWTSEL